MTRTQKVALTVAAAAVTAWLQPALAQDKAAEVMAATRKAIGERALSGLKTFSVEARIQRNLASMQITSESELLLEMPDKYARTDTMTGGPMTMTSTQGFNGSTALTRAGAPSMAGGGMVRMVGPGGAMIGPNEKPTPEQQEEMNRMALRSARQDISRLMLGWFAMTHPSVEATYTYAGEAESPDGRAHVIDVKSADGFAARLFIDQDTHLPLMLTYEAPRMRVMTAGGPAGASGGGGASTFVRQGGGQMSEEDRKRMAEEMEKMRSQPPVMVEYSLFFSDWRETGGIKFPHAIQRASEGTTTEEWTLSRVRVNPKIDAKKFSTD